MKTYICENCGKKYQADGLVWYKEGCKRRFLSSRFCCWDCGAEFTKKKIAETCMKKYGSKSSLQNPDTKKKAQNTMMERYGTPHALQNPYFRVKAQETCLKNHGVMFPGQSHEVREKTKQTNLQKYGYEWGLQSDEVKEKSKQTCLSRYGVDNPAKSSEVQDKVKQTCSQKYGVEYVQQDKNIKEKLKQTCLARYGVDNPAKSSEVQSKISKTNLERYGVSNVLHHTEVRGRLIEILNSPEVRKKRLQSILNPICIRKSAKTKLQNVTFSHSKGEDRAFYLLKEIFLDILRQYNDDRYVRRVDDGYGNQILIPCFCDFYIPSRDLFIEYQEFWMHGSEPFDPRSVSCQKRLQTWKEKQTETYDMAIEIWTVRDVAKRQIAKENNLNWLEFFSFETLQDWAKCY